MQLGRGAQAPLRPSRKYDILISVKTTERTHDMKTTRKQVEYRNGRVIEVRYCALFQTLRECADRRDGHTEGIYGWNADIYEFGNFAICTGYRPFGKYTLPYKFEKKWEEKAKAHYQKCYTEK